MCRGPSLRCFPICMTAGTPELSASTATTASSAPIARSCHRNHAMSDKNRRCLYAENALRKHRRPGRGICSVTAAPTRPGRLRFGPTLISGSCEDRRRTVAGYPGWPPARTWLRSPGWRAPGRRPRRSASRGPDGSWRRKIACAYGFLAAPEPSPAARTRTRAEAPGHGDRWDTASGQRPRIGSRHDLRLRDHPLRRDPYRARGDVHRLGPARPGLAGRGPAGDLHPERDRRGRPAAGAGRAGRRGLARPGRAGDSAVPRRHGGPPADPADPAGRGGRGDPGHRAVR